jgi:type II secretory pathway component PulM
MKALSRLQSYWRGLDARSRLLLSVAIGALVIGLFWAFVWQPVTTKRAALLKRIPQLETALETMRAEAGEIRRITALPAVPTSGNTSRVQADAAAMQSLFGTNASVSLNENRTLSVVIPGMAYGALLDRLEQTATRFRARVAGLSIKSIDAKNVRAEITIVDENSKPSGAPSK